MNACVLISNDKDKLEMYHVGKVKVALSVPVFSISIVSSHSQGQKKRVEIKYY